MGKPVPVVITVYKDKKFDFIIKSPPASHFIKEAAKLKGGSSEPGRHIVASITKKQAEDIANKKMADLNLLGITKDPNYGGMGLDYSYSIVFAEALGHSCNASVVMGIGVQTDMATPAIDRYGSDLIKKEFLAPAISGDYVASVAVSEPNSGSDVALSLIHISEPTRPY